MKSLKRFCLIVILLTCFSPNMAFPENQKPIMGGENTYTEQQWLEKSAEFTNLRESLDMGTRGAVVSVTQFLYNLEYRVPYANYSYQQRYNQAYAVYPHVGLNTQWGERYKLSNGKTLPPQGLYCSALVEWAFINAGVAYDFDITTDARRYKGKVLSTKKAFADGLIQIGDTVHTSQAKSKTGRIYNHIGIVVKVGSDYILVAEMLPMKGFVITKASGNFSRLDKVVVNSILYK